MIFMMFHPPVHGGFPRNETGCSITTQLRSSIQKNLATRRFFLVFKLATAPLKGDQSTSDRTTIVTWNLKKNASHAQARGRRRKTFGRIHQTMDVTCPLMTAAVFQESRGARRVRTSEWTLYSFRITFRWVQLGTVLLPWWLIPQLFFWICKYLFLEINIYCNL